MTGSARPCTPPLLGDVVSTATALLSPATPTTAPVVTGPPAHLALLGLGAVGAALVGIALGAEHLRHDGGAVLGVPLVALGAAVGLRGLLRLRRRDPASRREAVALAIVGAVWATATTAGPLTGDDGAPPARTAADAALVALLLLTAGATAAAVRAGASPWVAPAGDSAARRPHAAGVPPVLRGTARLAGWAASALVVATLTATGLAGTEAGRHAVDHGSHATTPGSTPPGAVPPGGHTGH